MAAEYLVDSCVRGYHYYQNVWDPFLGELLPCLREDGNTHDRYVVAISKSSRVVGHVLRRRGGAIACIVMGTRRYSNDLPQGGMEIPCQLKFSAGNAKSLQKIKNC